ncbi:MAG: LysM peptidoglycan-binding domain-containing protein [Anaerolineales bacterium]
MPFATATASRTATPPPAEQTAFPLGPTPTPFVHIVQQGETLLGIALRYGVTLEDLLVVNPGVDPSFLSIGQQIRIPGTEGEPVDYLLPTPTPVPLSLSPVNCYDSPSGRMVCLLEAENNTPNDLESLTVVIKLFDKNGRLIDAAAANAPLDMIQAGLRIPLSAPFSDHPVDFAYAIAELSSSVAAAPDQQDLFPLTVALSTVNIEEGLGFAHLEGEVETAEGMSPGQYQVRVVGILRNTIDELVGYNLWEGVIDGPVDENPSFVLDIFSLGPGAAGVEVLAQARRVQ